MEGAVWWWLAAILALVLMARIWGLRRDDKSAARARLHAGVAAYKRGDYAQAIDLLPSAAENGSAESAFTLADMYSKGLGVERDDDTAFKWLLRAADLGHAEAALTLGDICLPSDPHRAFRYWLTAAKQDVSEAQFRVCQACFTGIGAPQDYDRAFTWARRAALRNHAGAQHTLGMLYASRLGTGPRHILGTGHELEIAHAWLNIAGAAGHEEARRARDEIAERLSRRKLARAQAMARAWHQERRVPGE